MVVTYAFADGSVITRSEDGVDAIMGSVRIKRRLYWRGCVRTCCLSQLWLDWRFSIEFTVFTCLCAISMPVCCSTIEPNAHLQIVL